MRTWSGSWLEERHAEHKSLFRLKWFRFEGEVLGCGVGVVLTVVLYVVIWWLSMSQGWEGSMRADPEAVECVIFLWFVGLHILLPPVVGMLFAYPMFTGLKGANVPIFPRPLFGHRYWTRERLRVPVTITLEEPAEGAPRLRWTPRPDERAVVERVECEPPGAQRGEQGLEPGEVVWEERGVVLELTRRPGSGDPGLCLEIRGAQEAGGLVVELRGELSEEALESVPELERRGVRLQGTEGFVEEVVRLAQSVGAWVPVGLG